MQFDVAEVKGAINFSLFARDFISLKLEAAPVLSVAAEITGAIKFSFVARDFNSLDFDAAPVFLQFYSKPLLLSCIH